MDVGPRVNASRGSDYPAAAKGKAEAAAIPTHLPDRLEQSADYLPGFTAALSRMLLGGVEDARVRYCLMQTVLLGASQPTSMKAECSRINRPKSEAPSFIASAIRSIAA